MTEYTKTEEKTWKATCAIVIIVLFYFMTSCTINEYNENQYIEEHCKLVEIIDGWLLEDRKNIYSCDDGVKRSIND